MNTNAIVPLAALGLLAAATTVANLVAFPAADRRDERIVDLPGITVNASPHDIAYFRAHRIVDLPPITVHPEPADKAVLLAMEAARIARSPLSPLQATVTDAEIAAAPANSLATR